MPLAHFIWSRQYGEPSSLSTSRTSLLTDACYLGLPTITALTQSMTIQQLYLLAWLLASSNVWEAGQASRFVFWAWWHASVPPTCLASRSAKDISSGSQECCECSQSSKRAAALDTPFGTRLGLLEHSAATCFRVELSIAVALVSPHHHHMLIIFQSCVSWWVLQSVIAIPDRRFSVNPKRCSGVNLGL